MNKSTQLHYQNNSEFDVIDFVRSYNLNFCRANVVKYVARAGKKQDELQDLLKAKDYLEREIELLRLSREDVKDWKDQLYNKIK